MSEVDLQALIDVLAADLGAAVVLEDVSLRLLAHTDHGDVIDEVRRSSIIGRRAGPEVRRWFEQWEIRAASGPVRTPANPALGALPRWCVPVRTRGLHLGYIWVLDSGGIERSELGPAVDLAEQIAALLYRRRLSTQADSDLLRLLITPRSNTADVATEAGGVGAHRYQGPIAAIVLTAHAGELTQVALSDLALAAQRAVQHASPEPILSAVICGLVVLLAPVRTREYVDPARRLATRTIEIARKLDESLDLVAAIGGATDLEHASRSYADASRALRMVRAMPNLGPVVAWDELGVFRALAFLPPDEAESQVLDPRVRELLDNEELAATAETFLDLAGNVQQAATRLHVHRATLYQRLGRIAALYELDLRRNGDHRLIAHLGLKLARAVGH